MTLVRVDGSISLWEDVKVCTRRTSCKYTITLCSDLHAAKSQSYSQYSIQQNLGRNLGTRMIQYAAVAYVLDVTSVTN